MDRPGATTYLAGLARVFEQVEASGADQAALPLDAAINAAMDMLDAAKGAGRNTLLIGNGGSAAIVSHMHNDLCKMLEQRAVVFTEIPLLTAFANDEGYEAAFPRQMALWAEPGDVVIAISSSGESPNILSAVAAARRRGCRVLTFTGFKPGNRLRALGDINIYVPAETYGYVEMTHSVLCHCIVDGMTARAVR